MSEGKPRPGLNWAAVICFGVALAGIPLVVVMLRDDQLISRAGYAYLLLAFPTTPLGILGGIGALYGRLGLGLLLGVSIDGILWSVGITLSIAGII
jgi:hypothetical protein